LFMLFLGQWKPRFQFLEREGGGRRHKRKEQCATWREPFYGSLSGAQSRFGKKSRGWKGRDSTD